MNDVTAAERDLMVRREGALGVIRLNRTRCRHRQGPQSEIVAREIEDVTPEMLAPYSAGIGAELKFPDSK